MDDTEEMDMMKDKSALRTPVVAGIHYVPITVARKPKRSVRVLAKKQAPAPKRSA